MFFFLLKLPRGYIQYTKRMYNKKTNLLQEEENIRTECMYKKSISTVFLHYKKPYFWRPTREDERNGSENRKNATFMALMETKEK